MTNISESKEPKSMADEDGFVVRLRGLPWAVTDEDIIKFFGKLLIDYVLKQI